MKLEAEDSDEAVTVGDERERSKIRLALPRRRNKLNIPNTPSEKSWGRKNPSKRGPSISRDYN